LKSTSKVSQSKTIVENALRENEIYKLGKPTNKHCLDKNEALAQESII
jgi:hypothetical protein